MVRCEDRRRCRQRCCDRSSLDLQALFVDQTGNVHGYAGVIGIGVVLILPLWFVVLGGDAVAAATSAEVAFPLLSMMIVVPVVGALIIAVLSNRRPGIRTRGLTRLGGHGCAVGVDLCELRHHSSGFQFTSQHRGWDPEISWHLGVDGISLFRKYF